VLPTNWLCCLLLLLLLLLLQCRATSKETFHKKQLGVLHN
jgi:hypothetical protein